MDSSENATTTNYQQVTVDVPEDRVAEFHAFFARFLAGRGRGPGRRRGRYGRPHRGRHGHGHHGHGCGRGRHEAPEGETPTEQGQSTEIAEV